MPQTRSPIEDVQASADKRNIAIDKVGIKDLRHPVKLMQRDGESQHSVANVSMYVALQHHQKGTHMSRFIELLNAEQTALSSLRFSALLHAMVDKLKADTGYIEITYPFFVNKQAPVSGVSGLIDYEVSMLGKIQEGKTSLQMRVVIAATSLCPCSKQISDYGAHNQRSHITITAESTDQLWVEDLIDIAEKQASAEVYSILKRSDEKVVTERAYDNPKFVEDLIRDIAASLNSLPHISDYTVEAENFESIHNHSAYALVTKASLDTSGTSDTKRISL